MMRYSIGEIVNVRNHPNMSFKIASCRNQRYLLYGVDYRLVIECEEEEMSLDSGLTNRVNLPLLLEARDEELFKGKILHLDGDEYYLKRALQVYKYYGIKAIGYHVEEAKLAETVRELIKLHDPDILVLTGHDGLKVGRKDIYDINSYRFSASYAEAVKEARRLRPGLDDLVIISGACQSYYELLIEAGSNFASSPSRANIHLLDPVIIGVEIAITPVRNYPDTRELIDKTITKQLGGLDTRGKARKIYRGG